MKQSLLKIGIFGDEVYMVTLHGQLINKQTIKPIFCTCGNPVICESESYLDEPLKIIKKICIKCGEIN